MASTQKKPKSRRIAAIAAVTVVIIAAIAGGIYYSGRPTAPSVTTSAISTPTGALPTITMGAGSIGAAGLLAHLMQDYRLDAKYGFNLKVIYASISAYEEDLIARTVDVGGFGTLSVADEELKGHDLIAFAPDLNQQGSILVRTDSGINTLNDLGGKRVGFDPKITAATHFWQVFLSASGLNIDKDFKVTYADLAARIVLMQKGELDAISVFEPNTSVLLAGGRYKEIATGWDLSVKFFGEDTPNSVFVCYRDWYISHKELASKFRLAALDAANMVYSDPVGILTKYANVFGLKNETQIKFAADRITKIHIYGTVWDQTVFNAMDKQLNAAVKAGVLPNIPPQKIYVP